MDGIQGLSSPYDSEMNARLKTAGHKIDNMIRTEPWVFNLDCSLSCGYMTTWFRAYSLYFLLWKCEDECPVVDEEEEVRSQMKENRKWKECKVQRKWLCHVELIDGCHACGGVAGTVWFRVTLCNIRKEKLKVANLDFCVQGRMTGCWKEMVFNNGKCWLVVLLVKS